MSQQQSCGRLQRGKNRTFFAMATQDSLLTLYIAIHDLRYTPITTRALNHASDWQPVPSPAPVASFPYGHILVGYGLGGDPISAFAEICTAGKIRFSHSIQLSRVARRSKAQAPPPSKTIRPPWYVPRRCRSSGTKAVNVNCGLGSPRKSVTSSNSSTSPGERMPQVLH